MFKKILVITLFSLILFSLSACINSTTFKGSSENWEFRIVESTSGKTVRTQSRLNYIGDGNPPEKVHYEIDLISMKYSEDTHYQNSGLDWTTIVCRDCSPLSPDRELNAKISWEGNTEEIILVND